MQTIRCVLTLLAVGITVVAAAPQGFGQPVESNATTTETATETPAPHTGGRPAKDAAGGATALRLAIARCGDFIRTAQLPDGAFRFSIEGDAVRIWPYFGNAAARALIVAHQIDPHPDDLDRAGRWLDWYAHHMRADGNIHDFYGTIGSYQPSAKRDSIDVYPPSYLAALWRYYQAKPDGIPADELERRAQRSLRAIEAAIDPADGLTWSSVPHRYKYPMDNIDVCIGLLEAARLFDALGAADQAGRCRAIVARTSAAIGQLWLAEQGHFAWAVGKSPKARTFQAPYPDGVANIYLAASIDPPSPRLWDNLRRQFASAARLTADLWLAAAQRSGTAEQIETYTAAAIEKANSNDLTLQTATRLLLALAGDTAEPVTVPLILNNTHP